MFCQKCGNKIEENIVFCPKCGERLPAAGTVEQSKDNAAISDTEKTDETVLPVETATKAYELLKEKATLCPEVRSFLLKEHRSEAVAVGKFNQYSVRILDGQIRLNSFPVFPFVMPMVLCILSVVLFMVVGYIGTYYSDSAFLGLEVPVGILMLLSGLSGIGVSVFENKEKKIVLPFIRNALSQPKYIEQFPHIEIFAYSLFVFCGISFLILFGLLI